MGVRMKNIEKIEITIIENGLSTKYKLNKGENLLTLLEKEGRADFSHCGKKGICGKCQIRFLKGASLPLPSERKVFTPQELREGFRLACMAKPIRDCEIELHFPKEKKMTVVTSMTDMSDAVDIYDNTEKIIENYTKNSERSNTEKIIENHTENNERSNTENNRDCDTIIAIDLGTTTVAMELRGLATGKVYDTFCTINPQRAYGADVLSRIEASNKGEGKKLQEVIQSVIEKGIITLCQKGEERGLCKPQKAFLAGNTTMGQLLMGYPVESLGKHPFTPVNITQNKLFLADTDIVILPGISAFVGADIAAGIYYIKERFQGFSKDRPSLLIDLGTNGEMALGTIDHILTTATAAGPAFEGGSGETIMGADMVASLDTLLKEKKLDETGLLREPYFTEGAHVNQVFLKKEDVRTLQMAKAAVFSGICILMKKYGISIDEIDKVYLAGGFGYYLNVESATNIGLIPKELKDKVVAVGNSSLQGAFQYGKNYIEGEREHSSVKVQKKSEELERIIKSCENINLAKEPEFQDLYIKSMDLKPLSCEELYYNE